MSTRKECILCNNINFSKSLFNFEKFHLFLRNTRQVCDSSKKVLVIKRHTQSVTLHNPIPWHASIYIFFSLNIFQTTRYQQKYYTFEDPISLWKSENVDVANPVDKVEYQKNQWKHLPAKDVFCHQKIDQEPHWLVKYHEKSPTCYSRQLHGWTQQCSGRVGFAESFRLSLLYLRMTNWELQWKQLGLIINWDRAVSDDAGQIVKIMYYHKIYIIIYYHNNIYNKILL